ncbi:MAG: hypothetical protein OXE77_06615 [Flavobacteriaceae bacterium]|nr:hypothetical protein [Flavobacteriaceae bacterium]MCY4268459.1 hypothetical protein [Flavobacteriaceae bacterium]MCY4299061.1 hypothetical protein [Flavobacteriaceae bacterium]
MTKQSSLEEKTIQSSVTSKRQPDPSMKRLIIHISQADKNRFDKLKKEYLFQSGEYLKAGSNAGFFSYCIDLLVTDEKIKKLPSEYITFIGRRGKRSSSNSEPRNIALQLNLETKSYVKYIALMYFTTEGAPDISTAQFFPTFLDLLEEFQSL